MTPKTDSVAVLRELLANPEYHHIGSVKAEALDAAIAALEAQGEAVAWQYRTRKVLSDGWHEWQNCGKELADEIAEGGSFGGRPAEARALYTAPGGVGVEALRRDAERVAFLDTVSVAIHARNGRRYEAGPGNARDIIDMAQRYHAARQQEAGQTVALVPVPTTEGKE